MEGSSHLQVDDSPEEARVLLMGHACVEYDEFEYSESGGDYTEVVREHAVLQNFFKQRGCNIQRGTICDTELSQASSTTRISNFLLYPHRGLRILIFLGNGSEDSGAWCLADDEQLELDAIIEMWKCIDRASDDRLFIYSDSCHSGHLCHVAERLEANVFVQASCSHRETALDNVFTAMWIRAQKNPENRHCILKAFEDQNQQTVTYYAPEAATTDILTCGDLQIRLLGQCMLASSRDVCIANASNDTVTHSKGEEVYAMLPSDLQLVVAELLARPGWSLDHPDVIQIVEGLHRMCQQELRRGGDDISDTSDLLELLREFVAETGMLPPEALVKFNEEFN